ncbi:MAG: SDR family oxidoreductase [Acuticoccus sp.]
MLNGRCALVTGSTAGLGYSFAEGFAQAGADVVINGLCERAEGEAAAAALAAKYGVRALFDPADLSDPAAIASMIENAQATLGSLDILVNNAVVRHFSPIESFAPADWDASIAVNITAVFHAVRLALPQMRERGWGRIFNISSYYGFRGVGNRIDYVTTKTALLGMTRAIAMETATSGITCNALCPGSVLTPAIEERIAGIARDTGTPVEEVTRQYAADRSATGRFVAMENLAALAVFLCSPAGADITGAALPVDGGWFSL